MGFKTVKQKQKSPYQIFTGISFPFRLGVRGGVVMSTTSPDDVTHIVESMQQILSTFSYERTMEVDFKSDLDMYMFKANEEVNHDLIAFQITEVLEALEERIEVVNVEVFADDDTENEDAESTLIARIEFSVPIYDSVFITEIPIKEEGY